MTNLILKVTSEEVTSKATQIYSQRNLMEEYMNRMQQLVNELATHWQAQSGTNYVTKYTQIQVNIQKSLEVLCTHTRNLEETARNYESVEDTQVNLVERLVIDNIF